MSLEGLSSEHSDFEWIKTEEIEEFDTVKDLKKDLEKVGALAIVSNLYGKQFQVVQKILYLLHHYLSFYSQSNSELIPVYLPL